ncbi:hypothetical protein Bra3105_01025 [Brachybacterium halotolerans subsp. kimchii]|uniref:hypothetical protein n=1 Tax=Brachybacterium halotolerans TaxID=2795215 RepID=UPI001E48DBEA|nr:hypothetical protein [Brachybacterium halotolerans]UEJ82949.1 hypothetical protein Bra3105_01025 [Brachybacterium halotolerans subsp. kimchii]
MSIEGPGRPADADAQLLEELRFSASLCTSALESAGTAGEEPLAAAAHLVASADRTLHRFVAAARDQGTSWAQIGSVLGITRQAAQKRFSAPPQRVLAEAATPDPALVARAVEVMEHAATGDAALLDAIASPRMRAALGEDGAAPVLAGVEPIFGACLSREAPEARVIAQVTLVSAREHRERADAIVRVSLTAEGRLLGLHYDVAEPSTPGSLQSP